MKRASLYVICFPNGKLYVGRTSLTADERFRQHCWSRQPVGTAIRKYGRENCVVAVLHHDLSWVEAGVLEQFYISEFATRVRENGYNVTAGGEGTVGFRHSVETRRLLPLSQRGKTRGPEARSHIAEANRTKSVDPGFRRKISEVQQGKRLSLETRRKMSETRRGGTLSAEHRRKIAEAMKRHWAERE